MVLTLMIYLPEELKVLNDVELHMISQVDAFVSVHRLFGGGQWSTKGNIINFYNNVTEIVKKLPRSVDNINLAFVRFIGSRVDEYVVRPPKLRAALSWLKTNNPLYADIIIDEELLRAMEHNAITPLCIEIDEDEQVSVCFVCMIA